MPTPPIEVVGLRDLRLNRRTMLQALTTGYLLTPWTRIDAAPGRDGATAFGVSFPPDLRAEPFTGRVYVFLSNGSGEPRLSLNWFHPQPVLAREVYNLRPGETVWLSAVDPDTDCYPRDLATVDLSQHRAQAMLRLDPWERDVVHGAGNGFGSPVPIATNEPTRLNVTHRVSAPPNAGNEFCRLLSVPSQRLSEHYGRSVSVQGMVLLPASYAANPERRYPVIFEIPGFGGRARDGYRREPVAEQNPGDVEFIRVTLDPACPLGHHVFADSANNGPWGTALVHDFLPAFEQEFRAIPQSHARFLSGHSSGGWSSLWLQITHPDHFGGVWSTAPDPVDFRDFQRIDLYRPGENMYVDRQGHRRPLARISGKVRLWYDDFCRLEDVLGPGGQLHSFEAVFSPRGADGRPQRLWNRETGAIDLEVAHAWRAYDIREVLVDRWAELGPRLQGRLHVFMGSEDTFYLEGATRLLQSELQQLGSDAIVELHPGKDHSSIMTAELRQRIRREMAEQFLRGEAG